MFVMLPYTMKPSSMVGIQAFINEVVDHLSKRPYILP